MEFPEKKNEEGKEPNSEEPSLDQLSQEELLSQIEKDAREVKESDVPVQEPGDLLHKLGLSKKDKLKKENAELKKQTEELHDKYLRLYAEFDNFKKRNLKERIEFSKLAGMDVILSILPVLDDFDRALKQLDSSADANAVKEGVKLIQQKFFSRLESRGLKRMTAIGEIFDPELHDAVTEIPVNEEAMKGKVVDEIESGYYLNEKIIRHAKVVVGK